MSLSYSDFLADKLHNTEDSGFSPRFMPSWLFPFQADLVEWAIRKGRSAIFADCGMGKTPMQLVWAQNVVEQTNRPVLIIAPLAASAQTVREASKFDISCERSRDGSFARHSGIIITNYEKLHLFQASDFAGVVCDESSILKNFDGATRASITEFMRTLRYRLLCTATAAPNDYIELGTSAEALGEMGYTDMLSTFFKNDEGNSIEPMSYSAKWRFKPYAARPFWRWLCSWARAVRRPSDLGFDDGPFVLPPLVTNVHIVEASRPMDGYLFIVPAGNLQEQRAERRATITERCEAVASLCANHVASIVWCHLNDEGDLLERLIPGSVQVAGKHSDEYKELAAEWFAGNKCLCDEVLFSDKLSAWQQLDRLVIGSDTTKTTENNYWNEPNSINENIESSVGSITPHITPRTQLESEQSLRTFVATPGDASNTETIPWPANESRPRLRHHESDTQKHDGRTNFGASDSPLTTTTECSPSKVVPAPSAIATTPEISGQPVIISTTAIQPGECEDSCAPRATSGSANSATMPTDSSARPCICGHQSGRRVLISKPRVFGFGLNFQACSHVTVFPSHSYEQYYQAIRRCWRFGQTRPVVVDVVSTLGEADVLGNLQRKSDAADQMFSEIVLNMRDELRITRRHETTSSPTLPPWLQEMPDGIATH